jgi:cation diffusion facilitator family transporter
MHPSGLLCFFPRRRLPAEAFSAPYFCRMTHLLRSLLRSNTPQSAVYLSLAASAVLAVGGILLGLTQDSLAVRTNGIVAAIDIVNATVLVAAVQRSIRTPDYVYNYGYGKYESLALLLSATLLFVTLGFTVYQSVVDFLHHVTTKHYAILVVYSAFSLAIVSAIARIQTRRARSVAMPMVEYDADVWRLDTFTELCVFVGLTVGWVATEFAAPSIARLVDAVSALAVVGIALRMPLRHGRRALDQLLDRTLPDEVQYDILGVVAENAHRFCQFKSVHTRQSGKDIFVEIDVVMPYDYTFEDAYPVEREMNDAITRKFGNAITRIYAVPCPRDCIHDGKSFCPVKLHREQQS